MSPIYRFENPDPASALPDGPLHGMRVALQSTVSVAGWPTDADSAALTDFTALEDATVVQRLRQAGAALTGLTRASEFGFGLHGSQAGEAVRSDAADAELVLDMMGECRVAAARADAFGLLPSVGLVSRLGLIGLIPSMERCGLLARSCDTLSTLLAALAGPDGRDLTLEETPLPPPAPLPDDGRGVTLGVIPQALEGLPVAQAEGFRAAIDRLTAAGITVCELTLPEYNLFDLVHAIVGAVEASSCAGRYDSVRYGHRPPGAKDWNEMYLSARGAAFGTCVKSFLIQGAFFQFERYAAYENACRIRAAGCGGATAHAAGRCAGAAAGRPRAGRRDGHARGNARALREYASGVGHRTARTGIACGGRVRRVATGRVAAW